MYVWVCVKNQSLSVEGSSKQDGGDSLALSITINYQLIWFRLSVRSHVTSRSNGTTQCYTISSIFPSFSLLGLISDQHAMQRSYQYKHATHANRSISLHKVAFATAHAKNGNWDNVLKFMTQRLCFCNLAIFHIHTQMYIECGTL